jgi:hypothetical protein
METIRYFLVFMAFCGVAMVMGLITAVIVFSYGVGIG